MNRAEFKAIRIDKIPLIEQIQKVKITDVYMDYIAIEDILNRFEQLKETDVVTNGRIINSRNSRVFLVIRSSVFDIQIMLNKDCNFYKERKLLDNGDCIFVKGRLSKTTAGEITIFADRVVVSAKCLHDVRDQYFLTGDVNTMGRLEELCIDRSSAAKLLMRSDLVRATREFFYQKNYMEVETPILQPIYGGAAATPFTTKHLSNKKDMYLRIAPELYLKRLIVAGYDRIFEIGKVFRNEGVSVVHNPEFTMLECYTRNFTLEKIVELVKEFNSFIHTKAVEYHKKYSLDSSHLVEKQYKVVDFQQLRSEILGNRKEDRQTILDIIKEYEVEVEDTAASNVFEHIITNVYIKKQYVDSYVFLVNFPADISPLAKCYGDTAKRMEFYVNGFEVMNGYEENNDYFIQKAVFENYLSIVDEDYLRALGEGLQYTGGLGIGLDRLIMYLTNCRKIAQCISFL